MIGIINLIEMMLTSAVVELDSISIDDLAQLLIDFYEL